MSEIDDDLKISHLELSNNLGLTLTGNNPLIKHSGDGDLNILSNNGDIRINSNNGDTRINSNNGDIRINSNNIIVESNNYIMVESNNYITLQAANNNIYINGGFVGNFEILSSNGQASLTTLTTFLNAKNSNLNISLEAGQLGQIKNFVFYTNELSLGNNVNITVTGIRTLTITLNNPESTVSLLCSPISPIGITTSAWSIIGGHDYTII